VNFITTVIDLGKLDDMIILMLYKRCIFKAKYKKLPL